MFNFLISYANIIMLAVLELMAIVAMLRYFKVSFFKKISWGWLVAIAIILNVVYPVLLSWGQYIVWTYTQVTRVFLVAPLASHVPLSWFADDLRPYLEQPHGYFAFYIFNHFFLSVIVLLSATAFLSALVLLWSKYSPLNFKKGDILAVTLTFLLAGWPGIIILIPVAFATLILLSLINEIRMKENNVSLSFVFLVTVPFIILLAVPILKILNWYIIFKI